MFQHNCGHFLKEFKNKEIRVYHKNYECRIAVTYIELLGARFCYHKSYAYRILDNYSLSYWGQIFVVIRVMYAGFLLPIELLGPDFCCHMGYVCRIAV